MGLNRAKHRETIFPILSRIKTKIAARFQRGKETTNEGHGAEDDRYGS